MKRNIQVNDNIEETKKEKGSTGRLGNSSIVLSCAHNHIYLAQEQLSAHMFQIAVLRHRYMEEFLLEYDRKTGAYPQLCEQADC
jgi:hypothetical protein